MWHALQHEERYALTTYHVLVHVVFTFYIRAASRAAQKQTFQKPYTNTLDIRTNYTCEGEACTNHILCISISTNYTCEGRPAVDEERRAPPTARRDDLVHDAARRVAEGVLAPLAAQRLLLRVHSQPVQALE